MLQRAEFEKVTRWRCKEMEFVRHGKRISRREADSGARSYHGE